MNRRMFLCGFTFGACAAAFVGEAQQTGKVYRIGVLDTLSAALNSANLNAFRQGLRELGYVEGQHFVIEYRSADGRAQQFPGLATELVRLKVDLIVTRGTPAVLVAKKATRSIPIVMVTSADPARFGVVSSLARPGGNITGQSTIAVDLAAKEGRIAQGGDPSYRADCIKFELVINLKTAKALGLTIPLSLLVRADEIIHP
jgi:ABC-type uncharacterized transport system substrate-binding protein